MSTKKRTAKKKAVVSRPTYLQRFRTEILQTAKEFIDLNRAMSLADFVQIADLLRPMGVEIDLLILHRQHPLWRTIDSDESNGGMTGPPDVPYANRSKKSPVKATHRRKKAKKLSKGGLGGSSPYGAC